MATDARWVEWPQSRKHSTLIRLTLLWQQVPNVIHGPDRFHRGWALFFLLWNKGPESGDAWMPRLTETKVFLFHFRRIIRPSFWIPDAGRKSRPNRRSEGRITRRKNMQRNAKKLWLFLTCGFLLAGV